MWAIGVFPEPSPPVCIDCGKKISYGQSAAKRSKRCNSCASKHDWAEGKYTEERNLKIGKSTKQRWEDGEFDTPEIKAKLSEKSSAAWDRGVYDEEWHEGQSKRIKAAWARGDFDGRPTGMESPTRPECCVMEILDDWNIFYEFQFPIQHKRYDFFLPDYNLLIEYDSSYWHNTPEQIANDEYKDKLAADSGFDLFRLKELPERNSGKDELAKILKGELSNRVTNLAGVSEGIMI